MGFFARLFNTSWPLFVTHCRIVSFQRLRLIVFAFSDNISAENYKLSAESGLQRLQLLECMKSSSSSFYIFSWRKACGRESRDGCSWYLQHLWIFCPGNANYWVLLQVNMICFGWFGSVLFDLVWCPLASLAFCPGNTHHWICICHPHFSAKSKIHQWNLKDTSQNIAIKCWHQISLFQDRCELCKWGENTDGRWDLPSANFTNSILHQYLYLFINLYLYFNLCLFVRI